MATTKRAYKLQEFVAHTSDVNCLKIGRKTSRLLVTGGEDQKVNLWSIGKPNALLSLSGHTSPVESVCFDSSEVLVAAGAVSGTTKLWDLEEAKVVRSLTGHRSNCISIDFHPFGEFLASGSSDTNLKIWDVRRKACIHTYKGHNRGINAVRFTPDGRWVVSGGEDNIVKLWDLTAGKLLHDFKCHEGQIQCIDFHPHEFLLATGSADKTVKFWDLETFELIGSSGPEASGICYMTFNSYGRTLLCGLHKSLQVLSWEPIRYHDVVDMGWSRLSDLNVHDGKLLGCSYNQSCVGIWVVDILQIEPYAITSAVQSDVSSAQKSNTINNLSHQTDNKIDSSKRRSLDSQNSELVTRIMNRFPSSGNLPGITQRVGSTGLKTASANLAPAPATTMSKRSSPRTLRTTNIQNLNRLEVVPVAVPRSSPGANFVDDLKEDTVDVVPFICRTSPRVTLPTDARKGICDAVSVHALRTSSMVDEFIDSRRETAAGKPPAYVVQSKLTDYRKITNRRDHLEKVNFTFQTGLVVNNKTEFSKVVDRSTFFPINGVRASSNVLFGCLANKGLEHSEVVDHNTLSTANGANELESSAESSKEPAKFGASIPMEPSQRHFHDKNDARIEKAKDSCKMDKANGGRTKSLVASWESRERPIYECPRTSNFSEAKYAANVTISLRQYATSSGKEAVSARDEDDVSYLMKQHEQFLTSTLSRLTKLQVVRRLWKRNDVKGAMSAVEKMSDHAISADVVSILLEKSDIVTLDKCACLLPLLTSLVESRTDRFVDISLEMLLKLVKKFGLVIHSALSAVPSTGVDLHAEQRLEHCKMCLIELEKIKYCIPSLKRRRGSIANSVQELSLLLQDVFSVTS